MLDFKRLFGKTDADVVLLQDIFAASPHYFLTVLGHAPTKNAAYEDLTAVPEGCSLQNKFFYAIYAEQQAVGCIDLIRNYPDSSTAFLGLLLFVESHQSLGYGKKALKFILEQVEEWQCQRLRIAVVASNTRAVSFWLREGFVEIYQKDSSEFVAPLLVMERRID